MGSVAMLAGTAVSAYSQYSAGQSQRALANKQAQIGEAQANDALARGVEAERRHRLQTRGLIGAQRASLAAQGVDVNDGSALDVQTSAATMGEMDAQTIRRNSQLEAWGFRAGAANTRASGQIAARAGALNATGTILGGVSRSYAYSRGVADKKI